MTTQTQEAIYEMLTENTGTHFLDSGGENGRHWQRNQKKTPIDFINEEELHFDKSDPNDVIITKSLYHHLNESLEYLPELTNQLNDWINEDKYHAFDNPEGRSNVWHDVEDFMSEFLTDNKIHCVYTYNFDNILSQDIQYLHFGDDLYDNNIIALSIHNGADARGGLTDYKFFKVDWDQFLLFDNEYYQDSEVA
tara:strand:+ start:321 stop:902 length:582 start_codon:yes stop_codon:yes gene_type:complete